MKLLVGISVNLRMIERNVLENNILRLKHCYDVDVLNEGITDLTMVLTHTSNQHDCNFILI